MRRFLSLEDLTDSELEGLLASAQELEHDPTCRKLAGQVLGLLFMNPSLRTLASFQAGMAQLGGSSFVITPGSSTWSLETREGVCMDGVAAEHVREAIPVLEQYAQVLGVRCFAGGQDLARDLEDPVMSAIAACATGPLINLESARDHPCQALADWKTLDDLQVPRQGGRFVLTWAWHPRALPLAVPAAAATMAARRGMDVCVLAPEGFELPAAIIEKVQAAARKGGGSVQQTTERGQALEGAHVIYAKSWQAPSAYGDQQTESALRDPLRHWCVSESWFETAQAGASFLHCLPVRRNVVVQDGVLDGPRSQVLRQAANRLHVQKAVLLELLGGNP